MWKYLIGLVYYCYTTNTFIHEEQKVRIVLIYKPLQTNSKDAIFRWHHYDGVHSAQYQQYAVL